jgi:16S rRNA (cytidine1402-2'-O)-methyltransferase
LGSEGKIVEIGTLYICPTPIGNLEDITIRTINTLKSVDLIAAEDTRHTLKLLNHFEIKKPLFSYHEHNKIEKGPVLIDKLLSGVNIAQVSDAGMPGISDPGEDLIALAIEAGIEVVGLPGASASVLALIVSGLPTRRFVFEGFLPKKKQERKERLEFLKKEQRTLIFYEAPHRLKTFLKEVYKVFGDRNITLCRELTKTYEEKLRLTLKTAIEYYDEIDPRGEYVIVLEGTSEVYEEKNPVDDLSIVEAVKYHMESGISKKEAIKKVAKSRSLSKNEVYQEVLDL